MYHFPTIESALLTRADGTLYLMQYADGGYPLLYVDRENAVFCTTCAVSEFMKWIDGDIDNPKIVYDIFYEGSSEFCCECNTEIESAYGDPEENQILETISDLTRQHDCVSFNAAWREQHTNHYDDTRWLVSDEDTLKQIRDRIAIVHPHFWDNMPESALACITLENVRAAIQQLAQEEN